MAEWNRRGGGGRGGRGGRWRHPGFFHEQNYPPPFNPFFFPGVGFDPYQSRGNFRPPSRGPAPRGLPPNQQGLGQAPQQGPANNQSEKILPYAAKKDENLMKIKI
jgi:hypothetical protein